MSEQTTGAKIKMLRNKYNLTLEQVGKAVGVGKSTVRKWETGEIANIGKNRIIALCAVLHTTPTYLMGMNDEIVPDNVLKIEKKKLPLLGEIACGEPIFADEHLDTYVAAEGDIDADFCLRAKGDSMIGARIYDGDIVFIHQQDMVNDGDIAAVLIGNDATLKRVQYNRDSNELLLFAENPMYKTMRFSGEQLDQIRILGKAVAFQSKIC